MADHAIYNRKGLLIALGPYVVPVRIGVYALCSPTGPLLAHHGSDEIVVGIDAISMRNSAPGGTLEPGEQLLEAVTGEYQEECGKAAAPYLIHPASINFLSADYKHPNLRAFDDDTVHDPTPGAEYKLRCFVRMCVQAKPEQQKPEAGAKYPELIKPRFEPPLDLLNEGRIMRKSLRYAIESARLKRFLFCEDNGPIELDRAQIAEDWQRLRIHPDIIAFFCGEEADYSSSFDRVMEGLVHNLRYAEQGLKHLLQHKLPHHAIIRKLLAE